MFDMSKEIGKVPNTIVYYKMAHGTIVSGIYVSVHTHSIEEIY